MHRRDLLKGIGAASTVALLPAFLRDAAADMGISRYWLHFHAAGAWCPMSVLDPKPDPARHFSASQIKQVGPFAYGPYIGDASKVPDPFTGKVDFQTVSNGGAVDTQATYRNFFTKYQSRLLLIHGVDLQTGDHPTGANYASAGGLALPYPPFAAVVAASLGGGLPMPYTTNYVADVTTPIIGYTSADADALRQSSAPLLRMANANVVDPSNAGAGATYNDSGVWNQMMTAAQARLARLQASDQSAVRKQQRSLTIASRMHTDNSALTNMLTSFFAAPPNANDVGGSIDVIMACFAANLSMSGHVGYPGAQAFAIYNQFDTHANHDERMYPLMDGLLRSIDYAVSRADALKLPMNVVVTSDFGRSPGFNAAGGTDHNPGSTFMFIGPDFPGGKVFGSTVVDNDGYRGLPLDPVTLMPSTASSAVPIVADHIHAALRDLAGVDKSSAAGAYPIHLPVLPFFKA